ncbi:unnamed protein product, partial [Mesorhabditis belari]|uniref:DNA endonuclease activator Ctp1 C-terminal domain-containing protein n=1 Tax=Mesorhabditis belari TaxID=2138241 RepID=A0AAF3FAH5_9BILA
MDNDEESVLDVTRSPIKKPLHSTTSLIKVSSEDLFLSPQRQHIHLNDHSFGSPDLFENLSSTSRLSSIKRALNENTTLNKSQDLFADENEEILLGIPDVSMDRSLPPLSSTPNRPQLTISGDPFVMISPIRKEVAGETNLSFLPTPPPTYQQDLKIRGDSLPRKLRSPSPEIVFEQICSPKPSISSQSLRRRAQSDESQRAKSKAEQKVNERTEILKKRGLRDGQVIRKREDRALMHGTDCACCSGYYNALELSPEERKKRLNQISRHRYVEKPLPPTPEHYWEVDFPSTQELEKRGLIHVRRADQTKDSVKRNLFKR